MKQKFLLFIAMCLFAATTTWTQTATVPSAGDGTSSNPYEIANIDNLYWLSQNSAVWDSSFVQTADIDAADTKNWDISGSDTLGFEPIGNDTKTFTGTYNGQGHIIGSLTINRPSANHSGLFGYTYGATIDSLALTSCVISGYSYVGALVGCNNFSSKVSNCYSTGSVIGTNNVGGLVGSILSFSTVSKSYATGTVSGDYCVGGLVGSSSSSTISNSYAVASVSGSNNVGGLVGYSSLPIKNCYSVGSVYGFSYVGSLVGGKNSSTASNSYYNSETSGQNDTGIGDALSTAQMKQSSFFSTWDFTDIWEITNGETFPRLKGSADGPIILQNSRKVYKFNVAYNDTVQVLGMDAAIISVELLKYPVGMALVNDTMLTWTPTVVGVDTVEIKTTDANGLFNTYSYILTVTNLNGNGTEENPFEIATLDNLKELSEMPTFWTSFFIQTADIDASETSTWNSNAGFSPIGNYSTKFRGSYNGQGHVITGLSINRPSSGNIGMFGYGYGATIDSLGLSSVAMVGDYYVGALVGRNYASSTVSNSYATGTVSGTNYVGGLVGYSSSSSTISNSYATGTVSGGYYVGGLVGYSSSSSTISNSYAVASVSGTMYVGGLVGCCDYSSMVSNSYAVASVSGSSSVGGLVGYNSSSTVSNGYYNSETSGRNDTVNGEPLSTAQMKQSSSFNTWDFTDTWEIANGQTFPRLKGIDDVPIIFPLVHKVLPLNSAYADTIKVLGMDNQTVSVELLEYPVGMTLVNDSILAWTATVVGNNTVEIKATDANGLFNVYSYTITVINLIGEGTAENPYEIATLDDLKLLSEASSIWDSCFVQTADIDASVTATWNDGEGFSPIGNEANPFTGTYNGQGHTINGLTINRPITADIGLFGYIDSATIDSLGLTSCAFSGDGHVGGLVGASYYSSTVSNCYSAGSVIGTNNVGGLVGLNYSSSTISNSYAMATVSGTMYVGGLVGANLYTSTISNSYAVGAVSGTSRVGGLVGYNSSTATIDSSYYNTETSGQANGIGDDNNNQTVNGLSTTEMKQSSSFIGWDFTNNWGILADSTYPALLGVRNNAPFAFADTLNVAGSCSLLSNDYDYETGQDSLTAKLISVSTKGSINNGAYSFNANTATGEQDTVTYCVGELIAFGDTLWGNYAVAIVTKIANTAPTLSAVSNKTIDENTSLTVSLDDVTASDADDDVLSLVISSGDNYTVNAYTITPTAEFFGTLTVPVSVSDGEFVSSSLDMTITVEEVVPSGLSEINISLVTVYPNPATTSISVEGSKSIASIYNLVGAKVLTHDLSQSNSINISHLSNGMYILTLDGESIKVLKE